MYGNAFFRKLFSPAAVGVEIFSMAENTIFLATKSTKTLSRKLFSRVARGKLLALDELIFSAAGLSSLKINSEIFQHPKRYQGQSLAWNVWNLQRVNP